MPNSTPTCPPLDTPPARAVPYASIVAAELLESDGHAAASRRSWAADVVARGWQAGEIPCYGDDEWAKLAPNDPRAVAAVVVAAEAWRRHCEPTTVRRDLELELTANAQLERAQEAADFAQLAAGVRHLAAVPTQQEIKRRRATVNR